MGLAVLIGSNTLNLKRSFSRALYANILFHLSIHLRTLEQSGDADAKRVEEFRTSSVARFVATNLALT